MTVDLDEFAAQDAARPPVPVPVDWAAVEEWLGTRLPADYKRLADRHGPVDFGAFLWIHVPCVQPGRFDYGTWVGATHREARIKARALPEHERPLLHPEPGGLLAWGCSRGGDTLFWDTSVSDDPDAWTVVVTHRGAVPGSGLLPWHRYDLTLTGYLRHTVRDTWELPSPPGPLMGPLPGTVARTAFLGTAGPWTPPAPAAPRLTEAERRVALETGTGLEALRLLTAPPAAPRLGDATWEWLSEQFGTPLPAEYVRLMETYGGGCWSGWLRFPEPLRTTAPRLTAFVDRTLEAYESLRSGRHPRCYPLATFPEPGGFLPFADSIDGDYLGWLTEGDRPDDWPLVFWPRHAAQGPPLEQGLIDTLLAWQRGRLRTAGLCVLDQEDDPVEFARFEASGANEGG
ncbi:SMI1/KNR4 family protein [Streptomyces sp. NPDC007971]|uniref:SMI1/KNR4 family protein n=1 Tax=Streptomyces sp. NPDC007971 TaxID=3364799 RepID=UPI0036E52E93